MNADREKILNSIPGWEELQADEDVIRFDICNPEQVKPQLFAGVSVEELKADCPLCGKPLVRNKKHFTCPCLKKR